MTVESGISGRLQSMVSLLSDTISTCQQQAEDAGLDLDYLSYTAANAAHGAVDTCLTILWVCILYIPSIFCQLVLRFSSHYEAPVAMAPAMEMVQEGRLRYYLRRSKLLYSSRPSRLVLIVASPVYTPLHPRLMQLVKAKCVENPHSTILIADFSDFSTLSEAHAGWLRLIGTFIAQFSVQRVELVLMDSAAALIALTSVSAWWTAGQTADMTGASSAANSPVASAQSLSIMKALVSSSASITALPMSPPRVSLSPPPVNEPGRLPNLSSVSIVEEDISQPAISATLLEEVYAICGACVLIVRILYGLGLEKAGQLWLRFLTLATSVVGSVLAPGSLSAYFDANSHLFFGSCGIYASYWHEQGTTTLRPWIEDTTVKACHQGLALIRSALEGDKREHSLSVLDLAKQQALVYVHALNWFVKLIMPSQAALARAAVQAESQAGRTALDKAGLLHSLRYRTQRTKADPWAASSSSLGLAQ